MNRPNHSLKIIIATLVTSAILASCNSMTVRGEGRSYDKVHELDPITEIEIHGQGELQLINGEDTQLTVFAQQKIHEYMSVERQGSRLIVRAKKGYHFKTHDPIKYVLVANDIESIDVSGALNITANDYHTDTLIIDASGSTDVDMSVDTANFEINASGSFDGYLSGYTRDFMADFSGSADLNSYDLSAENVIIDVSGAATIYVRATTLLDISASGAAKINYKGTPAVSQSSAGAVSVSHVAD